MYAEAHGHEQKLPSIVHVRARALDCESRELSSAINRGTDVNIMQQCQHKRLVFFGCSSGVVNTRGIVAKFAKSMSDARSLTVGASARAGFCDFALNASRAARTSSSLISYTSMRNARDDGRVSPMIDILAARVVRLGDI